MLAALLATSSSLAWGCADFVAGVTCRRLGLITVLFVSQLVGMILLIPILTATAALRPGLTAWGLAALAGAFNAAALTAFYRGLSRGSISIVASMAATEAVIPLGFGLLHGERPSPIASIGIVLALAGVVVAAGASRDEAGAGTSRASVGLGLVAAVCFGLFVVALRGASHDGGGLWAAAISRGATIALLAAVVPAARANFTLKLRGVDVAAVLAVGVLDVAANVMLALATTRGAISTVGVLSSFYPVVTIVLAGLLLRERLGRLQRLGTIGALAGAVLIAAR